MGKKRRETDESKRLSSLNPLSEARQSHGDIRGNRSAKKIRPSSFSSSADRKADALWHRKTNAGYFLFFRYYGEQPKGVVTEDSDETHFSKTTTSLSVHTQSHEAQASPPKKNKNMGQSRASVRRKKMKRKEGKLLGSPSTPKINIKKLDESVQDFQNVVASSLTRSIFDGWVIDHPLHSHLLPFVDSLSKPLPVTIRMRGYCGKFPELWSLSRAFCHQIKEREHFVSLSGSDETIFKSVLPRAKLPPPVKKLLEEYSKNGSIARQELGSMLPVKVVSAILGHDRFAGSKLLDMCASPGSKTLQALEKIVSEDGRGHIVANDIHPMRLEALKEAVVRSGCPNSNKIVYTNFDASIFPTPKSKRLFDIVLADVPCSGDGTIRKDANILMSWTPNIGNELHGLQLKILKRAFQLVKVGGYVCYSTCSLNPVEDEAVVSAAILSSTCKVEIVDVNNTNFSGIRLRKGVTDWRVAHYNSNECDDEGDDSGNGMRWFQCHEDFAKYSNTMKTCYDETLWPSDNIRSLNLERCLRLLPQDQDSGGFFLALIRRIT